jgi:hypothetical protein
MPYNVGVVKRAAMFTILKNNQEIQFESAFSDLDLAKYYVKEHLDFNTFAHSLLSKKNLSEKQVAWVHYLATEHLNESLVPEKDGEYKSLVTKMYSAVKSPSRKFQVRLPGMTLSTITKGVNQGGLYIHENGSYAGKITSTGHLKGSFSDDALNLLEDAKENLLRLAKIYGHETGNCSLCGRTLSDPLSIQMGIGPICAKRLS